MECQYLLRRDEMKVNGIILTLAILLFPVSGFSVTHQLTIGSYSGNGFSGSALHAADACLNNGYYMCGSTIHNGLTGTLDLTLSGNAYTNIMGILTANNGTQVSITGGTLYSSLTAGSWGNLYTNYGVVQFDDLSSFYNGAANNFVNDAFYLWGQTDGEASGSQWGLDLHGTLAEVSSVQVPEPATMGLMALGLMGVVAGRRKKS